MSFRILKTMTNKTSRQAIPLTQTDQDRYSGWCIIRSDMKASTWLVWTGGTDDYPDIRLVYPDVTSPEPRSCSIQTIQNSHPGHPDLWHGQTIVQKSDPDLSINVDWIGMTPLS